MFGSHRFDDVELLRVAEQIIEWPPEFRPRVENGVIVEHKTFRRHKFLKNLLDPWLGDNQHSENPLSGIFLLMSPNPYLNRGWFSRTVALIG